MLPDNSPTVPGPHAAAADPDPPPNTYSAHIPNTEASVATPKCLKILDYDAYSSGKHLHDIEAYDDLNDDDLCHLTNINDNIPTYDEISSQVITTSTNVMQSPTNHSSTWNSMSCTFRDMDRTLQSVYIHNLRFNVNKPQIDSGANKSVTNDRTILQQFTSITPIPVYGVDDTDIACHLTGWGYVTLQTDSTITLQIKVYYSATCSGTIISPNAIVRDHRVFTSWSQTSHLDIGMATIQFFTQQNPHSRIGITLHMHNSLWYARQPYLPMRQQAGHDRVCYLDSSHDDYTIINKLQKHVEYELWHQRLMHVGQTCMQNIHKCTLGVPTLRRHNFHSCSICHEMNITKTSPKGDSHDTISAFGQRFQMDYGFMRGAQDTRTNIRSHEGYNCYLLIVDFYTRYTWVFLSKNKAPPVRILTTFLNTYGNKSGPRIIRTDQGGELARSQSFRDTLTAKGYSIEITGSDNSSQNSIAERPHRILADMVRAGLENAGLHVKYWSDALLHAVYIKNRLPHTAFDHQQTPYERLTGFKPDLSKLKVFGCPIVTRKPGKRSPKISKHSYTGLFLRYAKTMKNIVYLDTKTKRIKTTTTYAKFDEAHFSHPINHPAQNF